MKAKVVRTLAIAAALCLTMAPMANAVAVLPDTITVTDNQLKASVQVSNTIAVDLTVSFEKVIGLNANTLSVSAELLSPLDSAITDRLGSALIAPAAAFPVIVSLTPDPDSGFAFEGVATVELYTKAIHYTPDLPLRLFTSHAGGTFEDITTLVSAGSIRARGNTGKFSDFMILLDTRTPATIVADKAAALDAFVNAQSHSISAPLLSTVESLLSSLSLAVSSQDYDTALDETDALITVIENSDKGAMPDVWQASDSLTNVKGELLSSLTSLRYALRVM